MRVVLFLLAMVKFNFSLEQEIHDLLHWIYPEYSFFQRMPYTVYYPKIPREIEEKIISGNRDEEVTCNFRLAFLDIFKKNQKEYQNALKSVENNWHSVEKIFFDALQKLTGLALLSGYECFLSLYGPGGNAYLPNKISIRYRVDNPNDVKYSNNKIAHELIHLLVSGLEKEYNLSFEELEFLVDEILLEKQIKDILGSAIVMGIKNDAFKKSLENHKGDIRAALREYRDS